MPKRSKGMCCTLVCSDRKKTIQSLDQRFSMPKEAEVCAVPWYVLIERGQFSLWIKDSVCLKEAEVYAVLWVTCWDVSRWTQPSTSLFASLGSHFQNEEKC